MSAGLSQEQFCFPESNISCFRTQFSVGIKFALYMLLMFAIVITIFGNSIVIVSVGHFKQLHNPTNVLIASLAVVDLLVGIILMPFSAIRTVHGCWFFGEVFCQLHSSFDMFLTTVSILHLICIAVDRQQAICNPLLYHMKITMSVAWIMVFSCWALAAVYSFGLIFSKANTAGLEDYIESIYCRGSCFLLFNNLWGILDCLNAFFFPCAVMLCLYAKILFVAKKHVRQIEDQSYGSHGRERGKCIKQSEHKAAKTLSIVLVAFIICWLPYFTNTIVDAYTGFSTPVAVFEVFYWLGYFNSTLNPIIYALFYPSFKRCFYCVITLKIFNSNSSTMDLSLK